VKSATSAKSKYFDSVSPRRVFHHVGMSITSSELSPQTSSNPDARAILRSVS
jgi:hypothetical protein